MWRWACLTRRSPKPGPDACYASESSALGFRFTASGPGPPDDARHGLHRVRIRPAEGQTELRVPLFGAWDASHCAAVAIGELIDGLAIDAGTRYGPMSGQPPESFSP